MLRALAVAFVSASVLLAGCGDDGDNSAGDQRAADEAIAAVERFLQDDGFSAGEDDDEDDDLEFRSEECRDFDKSFPDDDVELPGETAGAESRSFERGEIAPERGVQETVQAMVGFVEEPDDLDGILVLFGDERLGRCIGEAFRIGIEDAAAEDELAVELSELDVEPLQPAGFGDTEGGVRLRTAFSTAGLEFPVTVVVRYASVGRSLAIILAVAVGPDQPGTNPAEVLGVLLGGIREQAT